jgi:glycolate oxidase
MDSIIEVNEKGRYAVSNAASHRTALLHLHHHPGLTHSEPGALRRLLRGNVIIDGQGDLAQPYGFNSDQVNGLEVVLPTGDVCRFGSCAIGASWFTNHPLPDVGLFFGWCGTTGIVTRLSIRLYPARRIRGIGQFVWKTRNSCPRSSARSRERKWRRMS